MNKEYIDIDKVGISKLLADVQKMLGGVVNLHSVIRVTDQRTTAHWYLEHIVDDADKKSITNGVKQEFYEWEDLKRFLIMECMCNSNAKSYYYHARIKQSNDQDRAPESSS